MKAPLREVMARLEVGKELGLAIARARVVQEVPVSGFPHLTAGLVILTEEDAELLASTAERVLLSGQKSLSRG